MSSFRLLAERYFDGDKFHQQAVLSISNGKITAIDRRITDYDQAVTGLLSAGFVDLQVNGGADVLFNHHPTLASIKAIVQAHIPFGTTAMLPTLITDDVTVMHRAADAIAMAIQQQVTGVLGIHFEGPHLSVTKKGAHSAKFIRPISSAEWQIMMRPDLGQVLVTLAPEQVPPDVIKTLVAQGIKVCLGHSNADFNTAQRAVDAGADGFTHLFNAMSPVQAREPGLTGCALVNDQTYAGIILDGQHVAYPTAQIALKTKPKGKLFLVTDAMPLVGSSASQFSFFDRTVTLNEGKLTSSTGELAGSVLDMASAVRNAVQYLSIELAEALRMASLYPARYLGQAHRIGKLAVNYQADMVLLDDALQVQATWLAGQLRYAKDKSAHVSG
jgi:N-acetylglucosamine-6-phosphate deacetylase